MLRKSMVAASATAATLGALAAGPAAAAQKACGPNQPTSVLINSVGTPVEGAVVDLQGRLWLTDLAGGKILRIDTPGAAPKTIATLPNKNGGGALALLPDGTVIVGAGADPRVFVGDVLFPGQIASVDPGTGKLTYIAGGFSAANGLAVAHDGTIYATNDFGTFVGRRTPDGKVTPKWAAFPSANGAVLSSDDKYLYESRTFVNAGVSRIPVDDPTHPQSLFTFKPLDAFSAPDGLTLDSQNRPIVPTDVSGEILRIDAPGRICQLAHGLSSSSVIVYGKGSVGFAAGHLYRAGFDGRVYEVPAAFDPGA
jgi:gluconolactonase